jgi:hypothetical protein
MLDEFLETDSLATAKRVLSDLGLTPVSAAAVLPDIWIPGDARVASLETWKRRCEQFASGDADDETFQVTGFIEQQAVAVDGMAQPLIAIAL